MTGVGIIAEETAEYLKENTGPALLKLEKDLRRSAGSAWRAVRKQVAAWSGQ